MAVKTPAQWKTLFENEPFHRENYYTGPLGPRVAKSFKELVTKVVVNM